MSENKQLRAIGAQLNPAATIGDKGLTPELMREIDQRLQEHELIKVRSQIKDREQNATLFSTISQDLNARLVQVVGRTALLLRAATNEAPKNSNLKKGLA